MEKEAIKKAVRERYSTAALTFLNKGRGGCCTPPAAATGSAQELGVDMGKDAYRGENLGDAPSQAAEASLGCGNPIAPASLRPGETVLDLGCGGGLDAILAARRVGPGGQVYGLDQNEDMLALARRNVADAGADNVILVRGDIENIPLPRETADVIISNCVINLSTDKAAALAEAFRVLRSGGRLAVSDMVFTRVPPAWTDSIQAELAAWAGCVAGAMTVEEYREKLRAAGFADVEVEVRAAFPCPDEAPWGRSFTPAQHRDLDGLLASASISARKPA